MPHLSKYELFSIKLLKQCISCLSDAPSNKRKVLFNLCDQCCTALWVVEELSKSDTPNINFSKLLLYLARRCVCVGETDLGVSYCTMLHSQLTKLKTAGTDGSVLLKQAFELLWHVALEQGKQGRSKEDCLELRKKALQNLLGCQDFDIAFILQGVTKAECCFIGASSLVHTTLQQVQRLYSFHVALFPCPAGLVDHQSPCEQFAPVAEYLLHRVVLAVKAGQQSEGEELMELSMTTIKKHRQVCSAPQHWPLSVQAQVVQLWKSITESPTQRYVPANRVLAGCVVT